MFYFICKGIMTKYGNLFLQIVNGILIITNKNNNSNFVIATLFFKTHNNLFLSPLTNITIDFN